MPTPYLGDALAFGNLGANLLALPNTIENDYQQAAQQRQLMQSIAPLLGMDATMAEQMSPLPAMQHFPGMQVPVLGSALRGIGTVGQLMQRVLGSEPAPRPPIGDLLRIAQERQERRHSDERLDIERQKLAETRKRDESLIQYRQWQQDRPSGGKAVADLIVDDKGGLPTPSSPGGAPSAVWSGPPPTPADFQSLQRTMMLKVKKGEITQEDMNAQLFAIKDAMEKGTTPQFDAGTPAAGAVAGAGRSGLIYGAGAFAKLDKKVQTQMIAAGIDPRRFTQEDVSTAQKAVASGALAQKGATAERLQQVKDIALTTATKSMVESAPTVLNFVTKIEKDLQSIETGPFASRLQEYWVGTVGAPAPEFSRYRTDVGLLQTALIKMHFGSRGGQMMLAEFKDLINSSVQSPENMHATLDAIRDYAQELQTRHPGVGGTPGGGTTTATLPAAGGGTTPGGNTYRVIEP